MKRIFLTILATAMAVPALADADYRTPVQGLIESYVRPTMSAFKASSGKLPDAVTDVCSEESVDASRAFLESYSATIRDFAHIHFLRFGPLLDEDRLNRLAFLPDARGTAQRQIRKVRAVEDSSVLSATSLASKSVALQGLGALQLLAFDKDGTLTLGQSGDKRAFDCGYAASIAENVAAIGTALEGAWQDTAGYSQVLLETGPENERFRSSKEALESVFNTLATGLTIARDQNLLPALGEDAQEAKPHKIPFARSGNGILFLSSELDGIERALASMELKAQVAPDQAWLFDSAGFEFENARNLLAQVEPPVSSALEQPQLHAKLRVLAITLAALHNLVAPEIAGALGLAGGFNSLDGD